ncbi:MAG: hypothetical protein MR270_06160 [Erysipelotrichaceae bacterium]|nr:hypothetical protein [Erysipelotrichaceae bacterium]
MKVGESLYNCNANSCPNVSITLLANEERLAPCDLITYTVTITNDDPNVTYAFFKDNMPCPIVALPGTVTINGTSYPTLNPQTGFNVNFLTLGNEITITYIGKAYGDSCCCVKVTTCDCCRNYRKVNNYVTLCYKQCCQNKQVTSNRVETEVEY